MPDNHANDDRDLGLSTDPWLPLYRSIQTTDTLEIPRNPLSTEALNSVYGTDKILPIESLKLDSDFWLKHLPSEPFRVFLSSGTTQEQRSVSPFSREGLLAYRVFALKAFWGVLKHFFSSPQNILGWSLIPSPNDWPSSSLAQMIDWIAEESQVHYKTKNLLAPEKPIWLFATAFHIVQFADSGSRCHLPAGSLVIETGGTKGKSRSVSRRELYRIIHECFNVPSNFVVSEYGMCELASQAYDFVREPNGDLIPLEKRFFRFPHWVRPRIIDEFGKQKCSGFGCLLVEDPIRSDLPWPIRTEDLVNLEESGQFQLEGRVPYAALKGCSLLAEEIVPLAPMQSQGASLKHLSIELPSAENIVIRGKILHERWLLWLASEEVHELFANELGSIYLADQIILDIKLSLPSNDEQWVEAARSAMGKNEKVPARWLIIPPRTHSVAAFHALSIGAILGIEFQWRASSGWDIPRSWSKVMEGVARVEILSPDFRLGNDQATEVDAILVFGSNETVHNIRQFCHLPVKGFGTHLTAAIIRSDEVSCLAPLIWKDALSLGQKGCMSVRFVFILYQAPDDERSIAETLQKAAAPYAASLPLHERHALVHARYKWQAQGRRVFVRRDPGEPLVLLDDWTSERSLASFLCDRPWALPMIRVKSSDELALLAWLNSQGDLRKLSLSPKNQGLATHLRYSTCALGFSNSPLWNGLHEGVSIFG